MDAAEGVWQVIDPASEEAAEARAMVGRQAMLHGLQARLQLSLTVTLTLSLTISPSRGKPQPHLYPHAVTTLSRRQSRSSTGLHAPYLAGSIQVRSYPHRRHVPLQHSQWTFGKPQP